jgi:3-dehydrosphinganine reductase
MSAWSPSPARRCRISRPAAGGSSTSPRWPASPAPFGYTAYCASKHAVVGFTDALRYELKPEGVGVHLVCPGEFDSPMVDDVDTYRTPENKAHTQTIPKLPVEPIAQAVIDGLREDRYLIVPGVRTRVFAGLIRWFPALARALGDATIARVQRRRGR